METDFASRAACYGLLTLCRTLAGRRICIRRMRTTDHCRLSSFGRGGGKELSLRRAFK
jgi:hypothetical protein